MDVQRCLHSSLHGSHVIVFSGLLRQMLGFICNFLQLSYILFHSTTLGGSCTHSMTTWYLRYDSAEWRNCSGEKQKHYFGRIYRGIGNEFRVHCPQSVKQKRSVLRPRQVSKTHSKRCTATTTIIWGSITNSILARTWWSFVLTLPIQAVRCCSCVQSRPACWNGCVCWDGFFDPCCWHLEKKKKTHKNDLEH